MEIERTIDEARAGKLSRRAFNRALAAVGVGLVATPVIPGMARAAQGLFNRDFDFEALMATPTTRFNRKVSPHRVIDAVSFKTASVHDTENQHE